MWQVRVSIFETVTAHGLNKGITELALECRRKKINNNNVHRSLTSHH